MRISDQMIPVEICTEATLPMAMLSSLLPKRRGFTRLTCCGVTVIRVGKKRLPFVQRLAAKVSALLDIIGYVWIPAHSWASDLKGRASLGLAGGGTRPYVWICVPTPTPARPF